MGTLRLRPCPCFHVVCVLLSGAEMTVVTTFYVSLKEGLVHSLLSLLHQLSEFVLMIFGNMCILFRSETQYMPNMHANALAKPNARILTDVILTYADALDALPPVSSPFMPATTHVQLMCCITV